MATKLKDLAEKLGMDLKALKAKIVELGFEVKPRATSIEDDVAELVSEELGVKEEEKPADVAEIYDEMIAQEREKEIVKSQRKKTAGKDPKAAAKKREAAAAVEKKVVIEEGGTVKIPDFITVKELAEKTGLNIARIIGELMKNGILANINQQLDFETAQVVADDLGVKLERIRSVVSTEDLLSGDISNLIKEDDSSKLETRPPVVVVMGHVDHGKTKLLDTIRHTDVVSGESGGITQHIGAYQVEKNGKLITFLDTPGHEAFTAMRARGAKVTDIAILVVAADEGVKPQTVEAINHAKEAGVPIIVALNKMDKSTANPDRVKGELTEHDLQPEDWGGKTVVVPISALKGDGVSDLLDIILLTAEMENLKANPNREAVGTVVEANLDNNLGPVATVLINTGTLHVKDYVIVGSSYGRIKLMRDHNGKDIKIAGPSTPVFIAGLSITPKSGDILQAVKDDSTAKSRAQEIGMIGRESDREKMSAMNQIISNVKSEKVLKLVLKADTKGSLEALKQSIAKIKDEEVAVKVIHSGVGRINESDVMMARASRGVVFGFHADYDSPGVKKSAEREHVEVRNYKIIYKMLEDIQKILTGLLEPEVVEVILGRALVKQVFFQKRTDMIVGCKIMSGKLKNKARLRVIRGKTAEDADNIVGKGTIDTLRKGEEQVVEIKEGNDCGIKYKGDTVLQEGDILEAYEEEKRQRVIG